MATFLKMSSHFYAVIYNIDMWSLNRWLICNIRKWQRQFQKPGLENFHNFMKSDYIFLETFIPFTHNRHYKTTLALTKAVTWSKQL